MEGRMHRYISQQATQDIVLCCCVDRRSSDDASILAFVKT
jgi:hypothetical protein